MNEEMLLNYILEMGEENYIEDVRKRLPNCSNLYFDEMRAEIKRMKERNERTT